MVRHKDFLTGGCKGNSFITAGPEKLSNRWYVTYLDKIDDTDIGRLFIGLSVCSHLKEHNTQHMVIPANIFQNELMVEIYSKSRVRAIG